MKLVLNTCVSQGDLSEGVFGGTIASESAESAAVAVAAAAGGQVN